MNYSPFSDRRDLLRNALSDAIEYEESRLDADVACGNPELEKRIKNNIKAYRRYMKHVAGTSLSQNEEKFKEFDDGIKDGKYQELTISEIREMTSDQR